MKYSQAAETAPQESANLNTEAWGDVWNGIKEFASTIFNFFKQNSKLVYGALGLMIAGPLGAAALPLLATAIEKGNWGSGDGRERDSTNNLPAINKEVTDQTKWNQLKAYFNSIQTNATAGKKVKAASVGVVRDLSAAYNITLNPQEIKRITDGTTLNLLSPGDSPEEPQFQLTGGNTGSYKISVIKDGNLWAAAPTPSGTTTSPVTSGAPVPEVKPKGQPRNALGRYTKANSSFNYNASKVLKEFYKNSKPLPIET